MSKNIKKIVAAIFSFILVATVIGGVYAFNGSKAKVIPTPEVKQDLQWHYVPNTADGEDQPSNYEPADGTESCPGTSSVRCIIEAPDNGQGQPDLDNATEVSFKF